MFCCNALFGSLTTALLRTELDASGGHVPVYRVGYVSSLLVIRFHLVETAIADAFNSNRIGDAVKVRRVLFVANSSQRSFFIADCLESVV